MNKRIAYGHYCVNSFLSCTSLVLYCLSLLSASNQIKLECILTLWKTMIEITMNDFKFDLLCHHLLFFIAACYVLYFDKHQHSLVDVHFVHFAFLFRNLRRLLKQLVHRNFHILHNCYLYLWLPTSFYRNYILFSSFPTIHNVNEQILIYTGSLCLCVLDIYWTPWNVYLHNCVYK